MAVDGITDSPNHFGRIATYAMPVSTAASHEKFTADELLWDDEAGKVNDPAPGRRRDDADDARRRSNRGARRSAACAPTIAYHGSENAVMNWNSPSLKRCSLEVVDESASAAAARQRIRYHGFSSGDGILLTQYVAHDAPADAARVSENDDPDDREVLVVVGAARQERAVERVRRGRDERDDVNRRQRPDAELRNDQRGHATAAFAVFVKYAPRIVTRMNWMRK